MERIRKVLVAALAAGLIGCTETPAPELIVGSVQVVSADQLPALNEQPIASPPVTS